MASPYLTGEPEQVSADDDEARRTQLVLAIYTAVVASSLNERGAFDAAVEIYRTEKPDLPEQDARRAVAQIICHKS